MQRAEERVRQYEPFFDGWTLGEEMEVLGSGTFGTVFTIYKGEHTAALKMISIPPNDAYLNKYVTRYNGDQTKVRAALRRDFEHAVAEIKILDKLNGTSNIVYFERNAVYERTDTFGWDVLIRMEKLQRLDAYLLKANMGAGSKINPRFVDDSIFIFEELLTGLVDCEQMHIVHLDIKPDNIFYSMAPEHFKLGDFGEAKVLEDGQRIAVGSMVGTYNYMPPEVHDRKGADHLSDLYSLALSYYWVLNRRHLPFMPDTGATKEDVQRANEKRWNGDAMPRIPGVRKDLMDIVLRCLDPDPLKRYQNAREARDEVRKLRYQASPKGGKKLLPVLLLSGASVVALGVCYFLGVFDGVLGGGKEPEPIVTPAPEGMLQIAQIPTFTAADGQQYAVLVRKGNNLVLPVTVYGSEAKTARLIYGGIVFDPYETSEDAAWFDIMPVNGPQDIQVFTGSGEMTAVSVNISVENAACYSPEHIHSGAHRFSGIAMPGATVRLRRDGEVVCETTVAQNGRYELPEHNFDGEGFYAVSFEYGDILITQNSIKVSDSEEDLYLSDAGLRLVPDGQGSCIMWIEGFVPSSMNLTVTVNGVEIETERRVDAGVSELGMAENCIFFTLKDTGDETQNIMIEVTDASGDQKKLITAAYHWTDENGTRELVSGAAVTPVRIEGLQDTYTEPDEKVGCTVTGDPGDMIKVTIRPANEATEVFTDYVGLDENGIGTCEGYGAANFANGSYVLTAVSEASGSNTEIGFTIDVPVLIVDGISEQKTYNGTEPVKFTVTGVAGMQVTYRLSRGGTAVVEATETIGEDGTLSVELDRAATAQNGQYALSIFYTDKPYISSEKNFMVYAVIDHSKLEIIEPAKEYSGESDIVLTIFGGEGMQVSVTVTRDGTPVRLGGDGDALDCILEGGVCEINLSTDLVVEDGTYAIDVVSADNSQSDHKEFRVVHPRTKLNIEESNITAVGDEPVTFTVTGGKRGESIVAEVVKGSEVRYSVTVSLDDNGGAEIVLDPETIKSIGYDDKYTFDVRYAESTAGEESLGSSVSFRVGHPNALIEVEGIAPDYDGTAPVKFTVTGESGKRVSYALVKGSEDVVTGSITIPSGGKTKQITVSESNLAPDTEYTLLVWYDEQERAGAVEHAVHVSHVRADILAEGLYGSYDSRSDISFAVTSEPGEPITVRLYRMAGGERVDCADILSGDGSSYTIPQKKLTQDTDYVLCMWYDDRGEASAYEYSIRVTHPAAPIVIGAMDEIYDGTQDISFTMTGEAGFTVRWRLTANGTEAASGKAVVDNGGSVKAQTIDRKVLSDETTYTLEAWYEENEGTRAEATFRTEFPFEALSVDAPITEVLGEPVIAGEGGKYVFTFTGRANETVTVYMDGGQIGNTQLGGDGTCTYTCSDVRDGMHTLHVVYDRRQKQSAEFGFRADAAAFAITMNGNVLEGERTLTGSAFAGARIVLMDGSGSTKLAETNCAQDGSFSVTCTLEANKDYRFIATCTCTDGVQRVVYILPFTTKPVDPVVITDFGGYVEAEGKRFAEQVTLSGTKTAGEALSVTAKSAEKNVSVDVSGATAGGDWSVNIDLGRLGFASGDTVTVSAVYASGVSSGESVTVIYDGDAPTLKFDAKKNTVNDKSTTLKCTAKDASDCITVTVYAGGKSIGSMTAASGEFNPEFKKQKEGTVLTLIAVDPLGHESEPVEITVDTSREKQSAEVTVETESAKPGETVRVTGWVVYTEGNAEKISVKLIDRDTQADLSDSVEVVGEPMTEEELKFYCGNDVSANMGKTFDVEVPVKKGAPAGAVGYAQVRVKPKGKTAKMITLDPSVTTFVVEEGGAAAGQPVIVPGVCAAGFDGTNAVQNPNMVMLTGWIYGSGYTPTVFVSVDKDRISINSEEDPEVMPVAGYWCPLWREADDVPEEIRREVGNVDIDNNTLGFVICLDLSAYGDGDHTVTLEFENDDGDRLEGAADTVVNISRSAPAADHADFEAIMNDWARNKPTEEN